MIKIKWAIEKHILSVDPFIKATLISLRGTSRPEKIKVSWEIKEKDVYQ